MSNVKVVLFAITASLVLAATARTQQVSQYRIKKLIGDLNDSPALNKAARQELSDAGKAAEPLLVAEIKKHEDASETSLISAARCLRALQEMKSNAAIVLARDILLIQNPDKNKTGLASRVLVSEALHYLSANLQAPPARKAICRFISDSPEKYENDQKSYSCLSRLEGVPSHEGPEAKSIVGWTTCLHDKKVGSKKFRWQKAGTWRIHTSTCDRWIRHPSATGHTLFVGVYRVLQSMVEAGCQEAGPLLVTLLKRHPYKVTLYLESLHSDGYTVGVYTVPAGSKLEREWIDKEGRTRIACLKLLETLNYSKAIPEIEKLLRSEQKDERDYALLVLEHLTEKD